MAAFVIALVMLPLSVSVAVSDHRHDQAAERRALAHKAGEQATALEEYFARARSISLLTANNPAFADFYATPGSRRAKVRHRVPAVREANRALAFLERVYPRSIGEVCFIDAAGGENARAVRGRIAPRSFLSADESPASFFRPTFALPKGRVYHARPYVSPDTGDWVVSNSTPVPTPGRRNRAIVHYEISVESFRRAMAGASEGFDVAVVDARNGAVIVDSRYPQAAGKGVPLGRPGDGRFRSAGRFAARGELEVKGRQAAYRRIAGGGANDWVIAAIAPVATPGWIHSLGPLGITLMLAALLLLGFAIISLRSSQRGLRAAALTDPLTGLGNRHLLMGDLAAAMRLASPDRPLRLWLFDLDGFKAYNDAFGHPAGDVLLSRLGGNLAAAVAGRGSAYRMGGDEFCVLILPGERGEALAAMAAEALTEHGEGFSITCSFGTVEVPTEAADVEAGLTLVDQRMYAQKTTGRASAGRQTTDVLLRVLAEHSPALNDDLDEVTDLCRRVGEELTLSEEELVPLLQAAALRDVGTAAIPDAVLAKAGPSDEAERAFMRRHTLIGERILGGAPALAKAALLVRWSHERMDGRGYPDGLLGDAIPLGARVIAACDAYHAMVSDRPYRAGMSPDTAMAELRACAGTQFDPRVVAAVCAVLASRAPVPTPA